MPLTVARDAPLPPLLERMIPIVDATMDRLRAVDFPIDPAVESRYSRTASIVSSAYKRHGKIIEVALIEKLRESDRLVVLPKEDRFLVSSAAEQMASHQDDATCLASTLPYGEAVRTLQIDLIVLDRVDRAIRSYEIKRGGEGDAGKTRSIRRDLRVVQVLLRGYGEARGLDVARAESRIIYYYGRRAAYLAPWSLLGDDLDDHFHLDVSSDVETVNEYFRERLARVLAESEIFT